MCAKANEILGLVKRVYGRDIIDISIRKLHVVHFISKTHAYLNTPQISGLLTQSNIATSLKNIQRRATKFILNYPSHDITYKSRLETLDMLSVEFRREISDQILLFKYRIWST